MWLFMTFQLRGTEEYFTRWYYILDSVVEILELSVYDHSNENHWADFPVILLFMLYKVVLTWVCENPLLRWFPSKRNTQLCLDRRTRAKTATLDDLDNYMNTRLTKKSLDSAIP